MSSQTQAMRSESEPGPQALPVQRPAGLAEDAGARAVSAARPRLGVLVLLSLAILLVALGQFYFLRRPTYFWDALTFSILGILAFVAAAVRSERVRLRGAQGDRASAWSELVPPYTLAPWRLGVLVIAVGFSLLALRLLSIEPTLPSYVRPTLYWLASIGAFILAAAPPRRRPRTDLSIWWEVNRRIVFVLAAIVLVTLALRVWRLDTIPPVLGGDEGSFGLESVRVLKGELRNPFITGWLSNPTMGMFFNAPSIGLFGNTSFGLRIPWALVGTATILMVFWLVTRLKGLTLGLMTAVLLATYHYHIHFSRLGINNASDPLFAAMALLFLYRAYDRRSPLDWGLCGVVSGAAQYFYFGARSIPIIVALLTLSFIVRDGRRFWREQYSGILILAGAFLITAAPMIQFAIRHPAEYNARLAQVGVLGAWLENEQVVRGQGAFTIMLDQFKRAVLAFNAFPDRTTWYGSPQPLFDATAGALFLLGLGYSTLRLDDRRLFPMAVWWWVPMILGGVLTESPPSAQRLVTLGPPAVFFVALGLSRIGHIVQRVWDRRDPERLRPLLMAAVLALSLISVKWYFVDFTPTYGYGSFNGLVATRMAEYALEELGPEWRMIFFGPPRMYIGYGTIPYLAPEVEGVDVHEPLSVPPDPSLAPADKHAAFIFLPERRGELELVRQSFPGGEIEEIASPLGGEPLFIVYRVRSVAGAGGN